MLTGSQTCWSSPRRRTRYSSRSSHWPPPLPRARVPADPAGTSGPPKSGRECASHWCHGHSSEDGAGGPTSPGIRHYRFDPAGGPAPLLLRVLQVNGYVYSGGTGQQVGPPGSLDPPTKPLYYPPFSIYRLITHTLLQYLTLLTLATPILSSSGIPLRTTL